MCNNLTFLSNPVKRVQLLIHLTLWTFSVDSYEEGVLGQAKRAELERGLMEVLQAKACNGVWGNPPARGNTSLCECYGIPQWVKPTFLQLFQKKFRQVCHSQTTPFGNVVPLPLHLRCNGE